MTVRPSEITTWADSAVVGTDIIDPGATKKANGWVRVDGVPEKPAYQHFNWWMNLVSTWIDYHEQFTPSQASAVYGANIYRDFAYNELATAAQIGFTKYKLTRAEASGTAVEELIANYQDLQTADGALAGGANIRTLRSVTALGLHTIGYSGYTGTHVINGAMSFSLGAEILGGTAGAKKIVYAGSAINIHDSFTIADTTGLCTLGKAAGAAHLIYIPDSAQGLTVRKSGGTYGQGLQISVYTNEVRLNATGDASGSMAFYSGATNCGGYASTGAWTFPVSISLGAAGTPSTYTPSALSKYQEGSFTATYSTSYFTSEQTATYYYVLIGKIVTIFLAQVSGTSNATTAIGTGLPAHLIPARDQNIAVDFVVDNGSSVSGGIIRIKATSGNFEWYKTYYQAFTNSGTKTLPSFTFSYSLN